jgi:OOP family OmpA-OmpF porin
MSAIRIVFAAAVVLALPQAASAQAQYTAKDVVGYFNQPAAAAGQPDCPEGSICLPKKGTRAVCIGTGSACASQEPPAAKKEGFDLLITFEIGSDELSQQAKSNLQEFAKAMSDPSLQSVHFNVDGHTDARGSDTFNMTLSERRAEKVVQYLESLGVDPTRLRAKGYGETELRDSADPFAAINRRVEATISTQ